MNEFYGCKLELNEDVKYIGEGENPADNFYMGAYAKALKDIYQPERLNPEGASDSACDSLNSTVT